MTTTTPTPAEIFANPREWFARFGLDVTEARAHLACPICADDRIAA